MTALALSVGPGRDRDTNVREPDGRGRVPCGNGRALDGITCPVQHSSPKSSEPIMPRSGMRRDVDVFNVVVP